MLEATLGMSVLAKCLNGPENATQNMLENKQELLKKDLKNLLCSAKGSANLATFIVSKITWKQLWDIPLERGVKGTRTFQSLFQEVCCPASCFECA